MHKLKNTLYTVACNAYAYVCMYVYFTFGWLPRRRLTF